MTGFCEICGQYGERDTHHIFNGAYRTKSEEYGATVEICRRCHNAVHNNIAIRHRLKAKWQEKIQKEHNLTDEQFINLFGKNYKEEE